MTNDCKNLDQIIFTNNIFFKSFRLIQERNSPCDMGLKLDSGRHLYEQDPESSENLQADYSIKEDNQGIIDNRVQDLSINEQLSQSDLNES